MVLVLRDYQTEEQIENRDKHIEREKNKIIKEFKIAEFIFEN